MKTLSFRFNQGITLVELMVVLAILGILLGLVAPNFSVIIAERSVASETKRMIAALKLARSESRARGATVTVSRLSGSDWSDELQIYESTTIAGNVAYAPAVGDDLIKRYSRSSRKITSRDVAVTIVAGEFISFNMRGWLSSDERQEILIAVCSSALDVSQGKHIEINRVGKIRERSIGTDFRGCS